VRARLIVNPKSGTDRAPVLLPLINERLRTVVTELDITITTSEQDIVATARRAAREQCELLFVAGGDGTLNVALRGLVGDALDGITIGVLPFGTGNDVVKALGLGEDPEEALDAMLACLTIDVDVGLVNNRPFVNTSSGGFVADVSAVLSEGLKDTAGKLAYVIGGARVLFGTEPFSARVTLLRAESAVPVDPIDLQMFVVANARYIGGGYPIAPDALIDDGLLDTYLVRRTTTLEFVALLQRIAAGEHADDDRIVHFRASDFVLDFDRTVRVNTDGELLTSGRCHYHVLPRAARFLCGPRPHAIATPRPLVE
jgi:diacylglycerol kinase (ATP)